MSTTEFQCAQCHQTARKHTGHYNARVRHGKPVYCGLICAGAARRTTETFACSHCGKPVLVKQSVKVRSTYPRWFCNHHCAASVTNKGRVASEESKKKTSDALRVNPLVPCLGCGVPFAARKGRSFCSRNCHFIGTRGLSPHTAESVLKSLLESHAKIGSTPSSKFDRLLRSAAARMFGSWNRALESAGIPVNTTCYRRKAIRCTDGHRADSLSERMVDDWFHRQGITHERSKPYPEGKFNCDFYLPDTNTWVEYFGLAGSSTEYDATMLLKRDMARRHGLKLVGLVPSDLYPKMTLMPSMFASGCSSVW